MKQILSLILLLCIITSFIGCANTNSSQNNSANNINNNVTTEKAAETTKKPIIITKDNIKDYLVFSLDVTDKGDEQDLYSPSTGGTSCRTGIKVDVKIYPKYPGIFENVQFEFAIEADGAIWKAYDQHTNKRYDERFYTVQLPIDGNHELKDRKMWSQWNGTGKSIPIPEFYITISSASGTFTKQ